MYRHSGTNEHTNRTFFLLFQNPYKIVQKERKWRHHSEIEPKKDFI